VSSQKSQKISKSQKINYCIFEIFENNLASSQDLCQKTFFFPEKIFFSRKKFFPQKKFFFSKKYVRVKKWDV